MHSCVRRSGGHSPLPELGVSTEQAAFGFSTRIGILWKISRTSLLTIIDDGAGAGFGATSARDGAARP